MGYGLGYIEGIGPVYAEKLGRDWHHYRRACSSGSTPRPAIYRRTERHQRGG
jgi:hypothetical protein